MTNPCAPSLDRHPDGFNFFEALMNFRVPSCAALALLLCCSTMFATPARAQSTDGYHKILIVPNVVSSGTFHTSLFIHNPNASAATVSFTFYQGVDYVGTDPTSTGSVTCTTQVVPAGRVMAIGNLATLCPNAPVPPPSVFGWLWAQEVTPGATLPIAIFSRVDNVGTTAGYEVEGYPAHTFTGATVYVQGLNRSLGVGGTPIQTNCFVAALHEATTVTLTLLSGSTGGVLGTPFTVNLPANQMVRLFDIFGSTAGNYSNGVVRVTTTGIGPSPQTFPGAIAYCTLQNNVQFDADFRIAKARPVFDNQVSRLWAENIDEAGINFQLGIFPNERSRHVVYFKHPDVVQCDILNGAGGPPPAGLEIRLYDPEGNLRAGGPGVQSFSDVSTGNKGQHGQPGVVMGVNGKWMVDVQASSSALNGVMYAIRCQSGSGHGGFEWIGRNLPHT